MKCIVSSGDLCRRRHKVAFCAELNLKFSSRFLQHKASAEGEDTMKRNRIKSLLLTTLTAALLFAVPVSATEQGSGEVEAGINHLYQTVLERNPDEQGKQDWVQFTSVSGNWVEVISQLVFSAETEAKKLSDEAFVDMLYAAALYREPVAGEKAYFTGLLNSGTSRSTVADSIFHLQEFFKVCQTKGLPAEEYLYYKDNQVLVQFTEGIQVDDALAGQEAMEGLLAQLTEEQKAVIIGTCSTVDRIAAGDSFVMVTKDGISVEDALGQLQALDCIKSVQPDFLYYPDDGNPVADFVERLYKECLGRTSDAQGREDWTSLLMEGSIGGKDTARGFFFSEELMNANVSNEEYVTLLYKVMLDRTPDLQGYQTWVDLLAAGTDRMDIFNGFGDSVEFGNLCEQYGIEREIQK